MQASVVSPERRKLEVARHHPDDCVPITVQRDGLPDDPGASAKAPLPRAEARYDFVFPARLILFRKENPSQKRLNTQQGENIGSHVQGPSNEPDGCPPSRPISLSPNP